MTPYLFGALISCLFVSDGLNTALMSPYSISDYPNPFDIDPDDLGLEGVSRSAFELTYPLLSRVLGLKSLSKRYNNLPSWNEPEEFFGKVLEELDVSYKLHPDHLNGLPDKKPLIIVSNHPFGALEALVMYCLLYTSPSPRDRTRSRMPSSA